MPDPAPGSDKTPVLEMQHISKRFDATQAVEDVSLALYPGEVHALIGENGAGKSTLIKIMTGVHRPDTGDDPAGGQTGPRQQLAGSAGAGHRRHLPGTHGLSRPQRGREHLHQPRRPRPGGAVGPDVQGRAKPSWPSWMSSWTCACRPVASRWPPSRPWRSPRPSRSRCACSIMDEPTASLSAHEVDQLFKLVDGAAQPGRGDSLHRPPPGGGLPHRATASPCCATANGFPRGRAGRRPASW